MRDIITKGYKYGILRESQVFQMVARPATLKIASGIATIGGIVALASMVNSFNGTNDVFWIVGLGLLITVLFFASAGYVYSNGRGNYPSLLAIQLINAAAIIVGIAISAVSIGFGIALIVFEVLYLILIAGESTERWMQVDRA